MQTKSQENNDDSSPFVLNFLDTPREYIPMTFEGTVTLLLAFAKHMQGDSSMLDEASEEFDNSFPPDMDWFTFLIPIPQKLL